MTKILAGLLALGLLGGGSASAAQDFWAGAASTAKTISETSDKAPTLADIESLEAGLAQAWAKTPLTQRHVVFVDKKPAMYGAYEPRPTSVFAPKQPLVTYLEPVGFTWTPSPDGAFRFGFVLDFKLKTPAGKILGGQDAFQSFDFTSRYRNREVFMNLTLNITGVETGDYVVAYTLHDKGSGKVSTFEQPFTIKE